MYAPAEFKRGLFAANRKPIPGAKTVKVVVVVGLHYYLPGEELVGGARETGELHTAVKQQEWIHEPIFRYSGTGIAGDGVYSYRQHP
jgi:hypothetical protein